MELYYVITIVNRDRSVMTTELYRNGKLSLIHSHLGVGTATSAILSNNGLSAQKKAIVSAIATPQSLKNLVSQVKRKMCLDIPGNGIMMTIPVKSVGGRKNMALITENSDVGSTMPEMTFDHELIIVILNEGHSDEVMDAARSAGATGGTIIHAKGTKAVGSRVFFGVSLAEEKDVIYIAAKAKDKAAIMRAINTLSGKDTPAGSICFSLPISSVIGLRTTELEEEKE